MNKCKSFLQLQRRPFILSLLTFNRQYDKVPEEERVNTKWERLKYAFSRDKDQNLSPELSTILSNTMGGLFIGCTYGGVIYARYMTTEWIRNNMATKFLSRLDAQFRYQDNITLHYFKGAATWGIRISLFCAMFTTSYVVIGILTDKYSVWNLGAAGFITGAIYKISLGIKGIISGGIITGLMGLIAGSIVFLLLKLTGNSFEDYYKWNYALVNYREQAIELMYKKKIPIVTGTNTLQDIIINDNEEKENSNQTVKEQDNTEKIEKKEKS